MKDDVDAAHGLVDHLRVIEIALRELDAAGLDVRTDVVEPPAREVVHHPHLRALRDERVHQVRSDERRASGHENLGTTPVHENLHESIDRSIDLSIY
jgi:hypothetical protein